MPKKPLKIPKASKLLRELNNYDGWSIDQVGNVITLKRVGSMIRTTLSLRKAIFMLVNKCRIDTGRKPYFKLREHKTTTRPSSFKIATN